SPATVTSPRRRTSSGSTENRAALTPFGQPLPRVGRRLPASASNRRMYGRALPASTSNRRMYGRALPASTSNEMSKAELEAWVLGGPLRPEVRQALGNPQAA